jgi:hypothetical protein
MLTKSLGTYWLPQMDISTITAQLLELQKQERELRAQQEAQQAKVNQQKAKVARSALLVLGYMEEFIDNQIKLGVLTRENVADYAVKLNKMTTADRQIEVYIALTVKLLSHQFFGFETKFYRLGNGPIIWKSKEYPSVFSLYQAFQELLGNDPMDSPEWFLLILQSLSEDPTKLPAEILIPDRLTKLAQDCRKIASYSRMPLELLPDLDALTADDSMWLANATRMPGLS